MKLLALVLCAAAGLSACQSQPGRGELFSSPEEVAAKDDQLCRGYGAEPGTELYVSCRMKQGEIRASTRNMARQNN